jgi:hypothetical protein
MVMKELEKEAGAEIDSEVSMMASLQNMKQGLKADYNDAQLLSTILNLDVLDKLIDEHVALHQNTGDKAQKSGSLVSRDASEYRHFVRSTYHRDHEDPFTHFYLKEAKKDQLIDAAHQKLKEVRP